MNWKVKHAVYSLWHDCIVHPICGLLWATRGWHEPIGKLGDRLHAWSTPKGLP